MALADDMWHLPLGKRCGGRAVEKRQVGDEWKASRGQEGEEGNGVQKERVTGVGGKAWKRVHTERGEQEEVS